MKPGSAELDAPQAEDWPALEAGPADRERAGRVVASSVPIGPRPLSGRLAGLSLPRQVYALAVWPLFQQLLNWLVSTVDTAVAGRLSVEATDAIAVGAYIGWLMGILHSAVGVGATALVARATGSGHKRLANAALGQSLLIAAIWGSGVGVAIYAAAGPIGVSAGLRGHSLDLATTYLRILAAALPLAGIVVVGSACLSGAGDTRSPFFVMLVVNLINLTLTIALVVAGMGVAGIALGTAIAWAVGSVILVGLMLRRGSAVRLRWIRLRPHWHTAKRVVRLALPNLAEGVGHWAGNWVVIMIVGWIARLGQHGAQGAHIIAIRIEAISFLPAMAFAVAGSTLTGQYLGAADPHAARRAAAACWLSGAGLMATVGLVFIAIPGPLVRLMTNEPVLLDLAPPLVRLAGFVQFFLGSAIVLAGSMRGAGDTRTPAILTNLSTWCVRLPLVVFFGLGEVTLFDHTVTVGLGWGLLGVWYALCIELVVRGLIFITRFFHGGWLRAQV